MDIKIRIVLQFVTFFLALFASECRADIVSSIKSGNLSEIQKLISADKSLINSNVEGGATALQVAIDSNQQDIAIWLIAHGANIEIPYEGGSTLLHHAALLNEKRVVEALIARGASVNAFWKWNTPLSLAASRDSFDSAEALIAHGADVNEGKFNPMSSAITYNHLDFAKLLISKGAKCSYRDVNGNSYLHMIPINGGAANPDFVDLFVSCGINIDVQNNIGNTPLHNAVFWKDDIALPKVQRLIEKGANVNAFNKNHQTPILIAASSGLTGYAIFQHLINKGADVNAKSPNGMSLLDYLSINPNPDIKAVIQLAIQHGADVNEKNAGSWMDKGYTPIDYAAVGGHADVGQVLIDNGADLNIPIKSSPLLIALKYKRIEFARMLINNGVDVHANDTNGENPLSLAVLIGNKDIVNLLIEHGVDVNIKNREGMTPLHLASRDGRQDIVKLLLEKGADINTQNSSGLTPIQLATPQVSDLLIAKGATTPVSGIRGRIRGRRD